MNSLFAKFRAIKHYFTYCGGTFYCPLCERSARLFLPNRNKSIIGQKTIDKYNIVAMGNRQHYQCPWCGSTDKERLVWWHLSQLLSSGQKILHIAPERNTRRRIQEIPDIDYTCGDKFYGDMRYMDGRYSGVDQIDVTSLPYTDRSFDIIICNHVLEHVGDESRALSELYRVLKKGGKAILQVPVSYATKTIEDCSVKTEEERERTFGQIDHVRIYGIDYPTRLEKVGFVVIDISPGDRPSLSRYGVNASEHLYLCKRVLTV